MTTIEAGFRARVTVDAAGLREAIKTATFDVRSETAEIRIDLEGSDLCFRGPGAEGLVAAEGFWKGCAFTQAVPLKRTIAQISQSGPMTLAFRDGRLIIGTASFSARWQDIATAPVQTPIGMSHMDYLVLSQQRTAAEIVSSGLSDQIARARADLGKMAAEAAQALREYGVDSGDLVDLVMQKARAGAARNRR